MQGKLVKHGDAKADRKGMGWRLRREQGGSKCTNANKNVNEQNGEVHPAESKIGLTHCQSETSSLFVTVRDTGGGHARKWRQ